MNVQGVLIDPCHETFAIEVAPLDPELLDAPDELDEVVRAAAARHAEAMGDRRHVELLLAVLRDELPDGTWELLVEVLDEIVDQHERLLGALVTDVLTAWAASQRGNPR